jgi:hypothetical protein
MLFTSRARLLGLMIFSPDSHHGLLAYMFPSHKPEFGFTLALLHVSLPSLISY